jgi:hypothetical protein
MLFLAVAGIASKPSKPLTPASTAIAENTQKGERKVANMTVLADEVGGGGGDGADSNGIKRGGPLF